MSKTIHIHIHGRTRDADGPAHAPAGSSKGGQFVSQGGSSGGAAKKSSGGLTPGGKVDTEKKLKQTIQKMKTAKGAELASLKNDLAGLKKLQREPVRPTPSDKPGGSSGGKGEGGSGSKASSSASPGLSKEEHATLKEYADLTAEAQFSNGEEQEADDLLDAIGKLETNQKLTPADTKMLVNLAESAAEAHDDPDAIKELKSIVTKLRGPDSAKK